MSAIKTMGIAVFVAVVTAASVVWYVDHKINQVTEAVMTPVHATTEKIGTTIDAIERTADRASSVLDSTVAETGAQLSSQLDSVRDDLTVEWDNAQELSSRVGDWLHALAS